MYFLYETAISLVFFYAVTLVLMAVIGIQAVVIWKLKAKSRGPIAKRNAPGYWQNP